MKITAYREKFDLKRPFIIARGKRTHAEVIRVELEEDGVNFEGECSPTLRYGETVESVMEQIGSLKGRFASGPVTREALVELLPPGAARNALDAALWKYDICCQKVKPFSLPGSLETAMTVSIGTPEEMAMEAEQYVRDGASLLKIKLNNDAVTERLKAVRNVAPDCRIIVDANEAWQEQDLIQNLNAAFTHGIAMVEQPLPAGNDDFLLNLKSPIPLCADESFHTRRDLPGLKSKYQMVNIKLDKTGGLTEALKCADEAQKAGLDYMVGCMLGTSLAMTDALPVAIEAKFIDLDGAYLLAEDRPTPLQYINGRIQIPRPA